MSGIKITIDDKALNRQIEQAIKRNPVATTGAVTDCVLDLAAKSAMRAPIESGDLRSNCHGQVQDKTVFENRQPTGAAPLPSTNIEGTVGYSLPYAKRQHEDLTMRHDRTDGYMRVDGTTVNMIAGGEAKYLENPFNENKGKYIKHIKKAVTDLLGKHS